jgi:AcrR family transcriptional regulator
MRGRDRLLEAARELFATQGLAGVTIDAIARRAGVSRATAYRWFPSPAALVEALVHQTGEEFRALAQERLAYAALPLDQLRTLMGIMVEIALRHGPSVRTVFGTAAADPSEPLNAAIVAMIERPIVAAVEAGQLRSDLPPVVLAHLFFALVDYGLIRALADLGEGIDRATVRIWDLYLRAAGRSDQ